jgi:hypothetical protein
MSREKMYNPRRWLYGMMVTINELGNGYLGQFNDSPEKGESR